MAFWIRETPAFARAAAAAVAAALVVAAFAVAPGLVAPCQAQGAGGGAQDHVALLKASLQRGQALIREYEWIETTVITLKGDEKARKQNRCYYGADGRVQKVAVGGTPPPQQSSGRRGGRIKQRVVDKKKAEMQDYMERAAQLIHLYVPPAPAQIQAARDAGGIAVRPQPGGRVRLEIARYLQPGDSLSLDIDAGANRLLGLGVKTYLGTPEDPVALAVAMGGLPDGATYAARTTLDAPAKNIRVVIENSGYRRVSR
jgi:hypothetical protein